MKIKYIYILSILILIIAAFFSAGYYQFDEHFQILEIAGLKLNMTAAANLPWEYHNQIRPALQPAIVFLLSHFLSIFGVTDPFIITTFLRLLSAAVAFLSMYMIYKAFIDKIYNDTLKRWFTLLSFFLWFMIYNNVRFSSENWSGSVFLTAFSLLYINKSPNRSFYLYVGLLFGLSFLFRYQAGLLIAGLILWHLFIKKNYAEVILLALGVMVMAGVGIIIDRWLYGEWTLTAWNYFNQNIIQDKVSGFGINPWWYYLERTFIQGIPPFGIIYIASFILVLIFNRKDLLSWTIFPFLLIHFIIGHKEIRFLFPVIGFLPIVIIESIETIQAKWDKSFSDRKLVRIFAKSFWAVNIILLIIISLKPADGEVSLYKKLYTGYKSPTILYYSVDNPYHRVLDINFYKRPNLEVIETDSVSELNLNESRTLLFVTKNPNIANELITRKKLIYSTFPDWIKILNFNNWMARTNCWYVYELY